MGDGAFKMVGTPIEIEAMLRAYFQYQRDFLEGQRRWEDAPSDEVIDKRLELFERTVFEVAAEPYGKTAKKRVRDEYVVEVGRIDTERELFDILSGGE